MKGLRALVETIELKHSISILAERESQHPAMDELLKVRTDRARLNGELLFQINVLLFDGKRPIVCEGDELREAQRALLGEEDRAREEKLVEIIKKWTGRLIEWEVEAAIECGKIDEVWTTLEAVYNRGITEYIGEKEEVQEILRRVGDAVCCSPDMMSSILNIGVAAGSQMMSQ